jgi:hypothetical protein
MATVTETIHEDESERHDRAILPKFPTPAHSRSPARRTLSSTTVETTPGSGDTLKGKLARALSPRRGSQTTIDGPSFGSECSPRVRSPSHELTERSSLSFSSSIFLSSLSHPNQTTDRQTPHLKRYAHVNLDWLKLAHLLSRVIRIRPRKPWLSFLSFPYLDLDLIASSSSASHRRTRFLRALGFCCCSSAALPCECLDRAPGSESSTSALGTLGAVYTHVTLNRSLRRFVV